MLPEPITPPTPPTDLQQACHFSAYVQAFSRFVDLSPQHEVIEDLIRCGLDKGTASAVSTHAKQLLIQAAAPSADLIIIGGAIFTAIGIAICLYPLLQTERQNFYVIWYGLPLTGIGIITHGLMKRQSPDLASLQNQFRKALVAARSAKK